MSYNIKLPIFEGPLDLLLHLIKKNELNIYDIPIATITQQYFEYLDLMKAFNLEIAGEFLLMAATLMHIKSKMLLPPAEDEREETEEEDPRAELIKRLIEYQRFKDAAQKLKSHEMLDRDVFVRGTNQECIKENNDKTYEFGLIELITAFQKMIQEKLPEDFFYVSIERMSINDKILEIIKKIENLTSVAFQSLLLERSDKPNTILTFLALLELVKLNMVKVVQGKPFGTIKIVPLHLESSKRSDA